MTDHHNAGFTAGEDAGERAAEEQQEAKEEYEQGWREGYIAGYSHIAGEPPDEEQIPEAPMRSQGRLAPHFFKTKGSRISDAPE